jgi:hypothetical protein
VDAALANLVPFELPLGLKDAEFVHGIPPFLARFIAKSPMERSRQLAIEFHQIEDAERRRLQDIMAWHTSTSGEQRQCNSAVGAGNYHPLSISAGVEKGHLNRYRNIFPVRLLKIYRSFRVLVLT